METNTNTPEAKQAGGTPAAGSSSPTPGMDAAEMLARLDGCRSSYFMDWFLSLWAADPKRLQNISVAELVSNYDAERHSTPCSLWRSTWEERDGKMEPVQTSDLFVWACVNTKTGEVEMTEIQPYDDELSKNLVEGWEWRRFRLIEANADVEARGK